MSRDLSVIELIKNASSEGHPILWHIVLKCFMLCGIKYENINIISWLFTILGAYIFIWKFPSNYITKILLLMTYPILYFCPSYARSYSLLTPIFITIAYLYKDRFKHPFIYGILIFLLCNTHIIFTFIAGVLFLIDMNNFIKLKENKKEILIILFASILGFIVFLIQMGKSNTSYYEISFINIFLSICYVVLFKVMSNISIINTICIFISLTTTTIIIKYLSNKKNISMLFFYLLSTAGLIYIVTFVQTKYIINLYIFILIFIYWNTNSKKNKVVELAYMILILLHIPSSLNITYNDILYFYSDSKSIAEYIENNIPKNTKIYCNDTAICESLIPYLNKGEYKFIDVNTNKEFTYIYWPDYYKYEREKIKVKATSTYYLATKKEKLKNKTEYKKIYETSTQIISDEKYILYQKKD